MSQVYSFIFYLLFACRFISLFISIANEKRLKKMGATEYGASNSALLTVAHLAFYGCCIWEGYAGGAFFSDNLTLAGTIVYAFSILMLYVVIYAIRHVWTVKLLIAPRAYHTINTGFLFRTVKHPNYFLNILPELVGVAFIFHAWYVLIIGLPVYLVPLCIRIKQEEQVMKQQFADY
ncbi:isoprenylcysteine carboxyl methyltransferase family protein [Deminuibacter soli]|uniref:DUF1295 domain-containing protein n=1 Tax=Deminuibacter soli TaxID=2291815 RepID=A0A3E1NDG0_9BACT|nr:isoprenylcysteine carboxylmethyltransferase family protein [Deminuibacter soli]RFM25798.1 hypothetical protein DXN05_23430 [Deminuibacter soli]